MTRVLAALDAAGLAAEVRETESARTAQEAADAVGCHIDQIAKSIIFRTGTSGAAVLFLTAGGNRVNADKATALAGESLGKADADLIRRSAGPEIFLGSACNGQSRSLVCSHGRICPLSYPVALTKFLRCIFQVLNAVIP